MAGGIFQVRPLCMYFRRWTLGDIRYLEALERAMPFLAKIIHFAIFPPPSRHKLPSSLALCDQFAHYLDTTCLSHHFSSSRVTLKDHQDGEHYGKDQRVTCP